MTSDIGERSQPLRMKAACVLRIAAGIVIQIEEKTKLDGNIVAGSVTMPRAVVRVVPRRVDIDGVVAGGDGRDAVSREHGAYFLQNRRRTRGMRGCGGRDDSAGSMRRA